MGSLGQEKIMSIKTSPFDATRYLSTPEARAEFLRAAIGTGHPAFIAHAKEVVARAAAADRDV